jgi:lactate dehydrogenase-like 2-hydroxyacid dehydrogenase
MSIGQTGIRCTRHTPVASSASLDVHTPNQPSIALESTLSPVKVRPRLVVTRQLLEPVEARLSRDYDALLNSADVAFSPEQWLERCHDRDGMICTPLADSLSADVIAKLPDSLRIIGTVSVGYNHIDIPAARARGIVVTNTPGVLTDATADLTWLLLLGAARRAAEGEAIMRAHSWTNNLLGTHVSGKALGIVGMGRIGAAVARRALGFNMQIHYLSRSGKALPDLPGAQLHTSEETFWPRCEFLSIHLPLNPETRGFLNARRIAQLPRGAIVVNAARGDIVDDDALIAALRDGQVCAAGLDVFTNEPNFRPEYAALKNTFLLPHLGSATFETRCAMGFKVLDNLDAFFAGREPPDRIA